MTAHSTERKELISEIPGPWKAALEPFLTDDTLTRLEQAIEVRRRRGSVFPERGQVFRALQETPLDSVRFVILGQDPYHGPGQAHGLCFSVPEGVPHPPSLRNVLVEWSEDTGLPIPESGDLSRWARAGGMLLNTALTVDAGQAHSHRNLGWTAVTDAVIRAIEEQGRDVAFVLWGKPAQQKAQLIDATRHLIVQAPHPSPLSAWRGFFGSRPFSLINQWRAKRDLPPIDWRLE